jgi:dTDP-4-dehydrorhamnose reductase
MKKILITGGSGVLAQYVKKSLKNFILLLPTHQELDITNQKVVEDFFKKNNPDTVIHLAAKTNVDECEENPDETLLVNSQGTKNIAETCKKNDSLLVYVSSAAVFDGKRNIFYEDDEKNPINVYGKSKLLGENYIQEILNKFIIIRAAWLIGGGRREKKFVSYVLDQLRKEASEIKIVNDKFGTLTYAKELADIINKFLVEEKTGVYHFGSNGACSRFDIASKVVSYVGKEVKLIPVPSSYFSNTFSAPRPDNEVVGSKKIKFPNSWEESLEEYLRGEILPEYNNVK